MARQQRSPTKSKEPVDDGGANGKDSAGEVSSAATKSEKSAGNGAKTRAEESESQGKHPIYARKRVLLGMGILIGLAAPYLMRNVGVLHHDHVPTVVKDMYFRPLDAMATTLADMAVELRQFEMSFPLVDGRAKRFWEQVVPEMDFRPLFSSPERPGLRMKEEGLKPHHSIIMVPGFITSGLEIWQGEECAQQYFRQRIWGTTRMLHTFLTDQACWLRHMAMDHRTGMDPPNIKLRAAQGLEAADFVIGAYWVWAQIIENLADIGYTSTEMFLASYDWRLAPSLLESRDRYMTRLMRHIELEYEASGRPVVILAHSYGSTVVKYFLNWVESVNGAGVVVGKSAFGRNGRRSWVKKYVAAFVNIAGPMFGVPPAVSSLLSGEMRDTADLGALSTALDYYLPPVSRVRLFRTWSSLLAMMPMGGETIWGNMTYAPDDVAEEEAGEAGDQNDAAAGAERADADADAAGGGSSSCTAEPEGDGDGTAATDAAEGCRRTDRASLGGIVAFSPECKNVRGNSTVRQVWEELLRPKQTLDDVDDITDFLTVAKRGTDLRAKKWDRSRYWSNPLASALPDAPDMKLYCLYGVGRKTERSYLYRRAPEGMRTDDADLQQGELHNGSCAADEDGEPVAKEGEDGADADAGRDCDNEEAAEPSVAAFEASDLVPYLIDIKSHDGFTKGTRLSQGDGTVPLISLGYMCARGWTDKTLPYNPSGIEIRTKEYQHAPKGMAPRGGGSSGHHVDILGNTELIADILQIAAGRGATAVEGRILSSIETIAERVMIE